MKLNDASPQQHLMILVGAGACIFLNLITAYKSGNDTADGVSNQPRVTRSVDAVTGAVTMRETRFTNPELTWFERFFCRGIQRSSNCSFRMLHPFANDDPELAAQDGAPKNDHVVYYRGSIGKNSALAGTIETPAASPPPVRILE